MRLFLRTVIALSVTFGAVGVHAQSRVDENMLHVNAYDDRIEARRLEEHREEERRAEEHREEAHREEAHREEEHREARIAAYNAWLQRWHEMRTIEATTP